MVLEKKKKLIQSMQPIKKFDLQSPKAYTDAVLFIYPSDERNEFDGYQEQNETHCFHSLLLAKLLYFQTACVYIYLQMFCCSDITHAV